MSKIKVQVFNHDGSVLFTRVYESILAAELIIAFYVDNGHEVQWAHAYN